MKKKTIQHLHFTHLERIGIWASLFMIIATFTLPGFVRHFTPKPTPDFEGLESILALKENMEKAADTEENFPTELFAFDPNKASFEEFRKLGLSSALSNRILNYRNKGGSFRKPEDFAKIYGMPTEDYERLVTYIHLAEHKNHTSYLVGKFPAKQPPQHFNFDPNTASKSDFVRLGLSERTAQSILNYREKGGKFKIKADFKRIYTLEESDFDRLLPYIDLPERPIAYAGQQSSTAVPVAYSQPYTKPQTYEKQYKSDIEIDINQASEADFQQLRGIGPAFARRIVQYREKLGGFSSVAQVAETYNLPDSVFQKIESQLRPSLVFRLLSINTATEEELSTHPYLSFKEAKSIVQYRTQHGPFRKKEDLKLIRSLDANRVERLLPYIKVE